MENSSRAEYFRKRRKDNPQFMVSVDRERMDRFKLALKKRGIKRADWLREQMDLEIERTLGEK